MPPRKPPPRSAPDETPKIKLSEKASHHSARSVKLTDAQKIQADIIDWKRGSVRALLFLAYTILAHVMASICILCYTLTVIEESVWLRLVYYGFFGNLFLYFYGTGAAVQAITYVWNSCEFIFGMVLIYLSIGINVGLFLMTRITSDNYEITEGFPNSLINDCSNTTFLNTNDTSSFSLELVVRFDKLRTLCPKFESKLLHLYFFFLPFILPPIALASSIYAIIAAYVALNVIPKRFTKGTIDAKWVEPYEPYDFYVGRVITRAPGDSGHDEYSNIVSLFEEESHVNVPLHVKIDEFNEITSIRRSKLNTADKKYD